VKLSKLKINENNPRTIKKEKFEKLIKSIEEFPKMMELRPIVADKSGTILGGNMRYRALLEMGRTEIPDKWVKIADKLTEEEKKRFVVEDNLPFGEWDWDMLANNYDYGELLDWGFSEEELKIDKEVVEDEVPEIEEGEAKSKYGEVYQLGRHYLMCGDSTKIEDVEKLINGQKADMVFTDPPYGISLDSSYSGFPTGWENQQLKHKFEPSIKGDDKPFDATHLVNFEAKEVFLWGADYYANTLPNSGVNGTYYVWDKREEENFDKMLGSPYELCWSKVKHKKDIIRMRWASFLHGKATEGEQSKNRLHPTQKPLALASWFYKKFSKENDIIVDLYGGSGSFLIACEQTNRVCYMMEIDPKYCDVIRKRYANFIGKGEEWERITPKAQ